VKATLHWRCLAFLAHLFVWTTSALAAPEAVPSNPLRPWTEYRAIMWIGESVWKQPAKVPLFFQRLREMGINAAMVYGDGNPQPLLDNRFPYYVENVINRGLCLKWSSKVRDWDRFVTDWTKQGRPESAFLRDYCLDDPQWRSWARGEMQRVVRKNAPHQPLAYDIRDELSTTISANPFDYDFNPITLAKFRDWLKDQYRPDSERPLTPSLSPDEGEGARRGEGESRAAQAALAALNAQWETQFKSWDDVKPFTTDQIKHRMASGDAIPRGKPDWPALQRLKFDPVEARQQPTRWNFSPWCDFRTYMDISLAAALDDLRQAARAIDPHTPVGIEGTQMPHAFGGYDLWRLAQVLDWVEPYDIGNAREILGSFMPGKPILTTVFEKDTSHAMRRLWHLLIEGDKGCIIWWSEDCIDWKSADYALTPKAKALAPVLQEMTSPLAQLFLRAEKEYDPIGIHYSQPSIQVDWLIESTGDGSTWHRRFSSFEAEHNRMAQVRNSWLKAFQDLGYSPRFISREQIETGGLRGVQILVLPDSRALSDIELQAIQAFWRTFSGQMLFLSDAPGMFDEHGRLRAKQPRVGDFLQDQPEPFVVSQHNLATLRPDAQFKDASVYAKQRLQLSQTTNVQWISDMAGLQHERAVVTVRFDTRTRIHRFKLGSARLLAFERNVDYHMSEELQQAGGNEALEKPIDLEARLAKAAHVYNLRTRQYLGQTDRIAFHLDPWQPSLFALLEEQIPAEGLMVFLAQQANGRR
jgi:hypothetical protein